MKSTQCLFFSAAAFLASALAFNTIVGLPPPAAPIGVRIVEAATALVASLDPAQQKLALFAGDSEERFNWHFIPRDRKGVPVKELKDDQRAKVTGLLRATLSEPGAHKSEEIMALESVLAEIEGPDRKFPRDPLLYYVSIFGKPGLEGRWGWRLEGHHLSVNCTLDGAKVLSLTPFFQGANPALVKSGPKKGLRLLASQEDLARSLATSLSEEQLRAARSAGEPEEVPGRRKKSYDGPFPAGIAAAQLSAGQKDQLRSLVKAYTDNLASETVAPVLKCIDGGLDDVHFVWRGGLKSGEGHSYMVHGPGFMVNYINAQNDAMHVHACLRMLRGEFGQ
jgi:hypothetical protein